MINDMHIIDVQPQQKNAACRAQLTLCQSSWC